MASHQQQRGLGRGRKGASARLARLGPATTQPPPCRQGRSRLARSQGLAAAAIWTSARGRPWRIDASSLSTARTCAAHIPAGFQACLGMHEVDSALLTMTNAQGKCAFARDRSHRAVLDGLANMTGVSDHVHGPGGGRWKKSESSRSTLPMTGTCFAFWKTGH